MVPANPMYVQTREHTARTHSNACMSSAAQTAVCSQRPCSAQAPSAEALGALEHPPIGTKGRPLSIEGWACWVWTQRHRALHPGRGGQTAGEPVRLCVCVDCVVLCVCGCVWAGACVRACCDVAVLQSKQAHVYKKKL